MTSIADLVGQMLEEAEAEGVFEKKAPAPRKHPEVPEHIEARSKEYYQYLHKLACRRHYQTHRELINERNRAWQEKNAEKVREGYRRRYQENKTIKVTCPCGGEYHKSNKSKHVKTMKHQAYLALHPEPQDAESSDGEGAIFE